jgi:hypothetical protein
LSLFPRVKRQELEADYAPPYTAEVKNGGIIPPLPNVLMAYRDNFTFSTT